MTQDSREREAFRVRHQLGFSFKPVAEADLDAWEPEQLFEDSEALGVLTQLKRIDRETAKTLNALTESNRLLGEYLQRLNQKVDLLVRHSVLQHTLSDRTRELSLSETGVSFVHPQALAQGSYLALRLVFTEEYIAIFSFAKVVRSQEVNGAYQIAAEFYKLSEKDRQELARQVFKAQVNDRRRQAK